jgi:hypothetical protein
MKPLALIFTLVILSCIFSYGQDVPSTVENKSASSWVTISSETKPWTRWWWHGSALTKEGITYELEAFKKAGLGGVEITPIYGVHGYEDKFINFLSPAWMALLTHTLKEGKRLGLGIDMATGTGWPFGGPWVSSADACKNIHHKVYELEGGQRLREKIEFVQAPYLKAVGNQIHKVYDSVTAPVGDRKDQVLRQRTSPPDIKDLVEPISANQDLQSLALDQVQFEKPLLLQTLVAYGSKGEFVDPTSKVDDQGSLNWTAPPGKWKLYALFQGWHGKMVERAGPGGEGNVIDHFSAEALTHYLNRFDSAFQRSDIGPLRAFFNDSYEVDDARGTADWTPKLLDDFKVRRGYDLREHLPALFNHDDKGKNERILCDYRETISELLLENFTKPWKAWANKKNALTRNQAHGSPANILDLYSAVDIPEIEGTEPLRIKMASSAAHVTGKKLTSAEAATWLNEHFESNLGDIKIAVDKFLLNGVNHVVYHGTTYSPVNENWPGWLFYAAVHLNPRNPLWNDFDALNAYVTRCQSFLQNSSPDNDILLYYPVYDRFSTPGSELIEHFDGIGKQFEGTDFERCAKMMHDNGYAFDYISDKQISALTFTDGVIITQGNTRYQTIVIPRCKYIPVETLDKLFQLAQAGAQVIFSEALPETFPGYGNFKNDSINFSALQNRIVNSADKAKLMTGSDLSGLLGKTLCRRESLADENIAFIRKKSADGIFLYFISNQKESAFTGWISLRSYASSVQIYDPMTGTSGKALTASSDHKSLKVFIQLAGKQSLILTGTQESNAALYPFYEPTGKPVTIQSKWHITFASGGPQLPPAIKTDSLTSWTNFTGEEYKSFSGTAIYKTTFDHHHLSSATHWQLDLGTVDESAEIFINGRALGTVISSPYVVVIPSSLLKKKNILEIHVSNLMMNRIADLDRRKVFWKKFYNVNFPARLAENRKNGLFDAASMPVRSSGLLGPVRLIPIQKIAGFKAP